MSFPVESFWKLVVESNLLSLEDCHRYHAVWAAQNPQGDAQQLAEWLFAQNVLSRYQASILLAGRAGPFLYGDYKIYDRIDSGRLKGIFRAVHVPTNHTVCLQFLSPEQSSTPDKVARLTQQANLVSRSSAGFPHLLRCYHLVDLGTYKFFVLEDLQGKRIERILSKEGARPQSEACSAARQIAAALARLHAMQQAHGDVRPANIWVDASSTVKLMQFPLSRDPLAAPIDWRKLLAGGATSIPLEADFVAPELISGSRPDARSDIYQLGCSLYTMLTNQVPFPVKSLRDKLEGHLKQAPTPIETLNPSVAPALAKVVGYMMAKKPDLRYQQATTVIEKLIPFMSAEDARSQPQPPTRAAQLYDAWLQERLSAAPAPAAAAPAPPAQPAMPQAMPVQAAMASPPGSQPYGAASPYAQSPYSATPQPYGYGQAAPYGAAAPMATAAPAAPQYAAAPVPQQAPAPPAYEEPAPAPTFQKVSARAPAAPFAATEPVRTKSGGSTGLIIGGVVLLVGAVVGFVAWNRTNSKPLTNTTSVAQKQATTAAKGTAGAAKPGAAKAAGTAAGSAPQAPAAPQGVVVPFRDTLTGLGDALWESPTAGKQLTLNYLCRGSSLVVALRPADIMKHAESERLLDDKVLGSLAPWFQTTLPQWAGTTHDQIEQALVGVLDGGDAVRTCCVIHLKTAATEETLVKAWGDPAPEQAEDATYYVKEDKAYFLPAAGKGKVIVVAPKEEMPDLLMLKGSPPPLARRELDVLMQATDADRQLTILFSPQFLASGGKALLAGGLERAQTAMNWLFTGYGLPAVGETTMPPPASPDEAEPPKAALFSAHLSGNGGTEGLFWELRLYNAMANSLTESAVEPLAKRVKEVGSRVEQYYISLNPSPYSKAILYKYPAMVKFFCNNVRAAAGDKQYVLRGAAPDLATHNILLGAYLCLIESPGGYVAGGPSGTGAPAGPKKMGALDLLRTKKFALAFDRNDLNKVLDIVSNELGVPIEMHGDDFRAAGITKNQSMGLNEPEQTIDKLLQVILKKANIDGQLVYVIKPSADGGEMVQIITRKGAADRKEKMLPEFEQAPVKK
jgi:hypothetical protein